MSRKSKSKRRPSRAAFQENRRRWIGRMQNADAMEEAIRQQLREDGIELVVSRGQNVHWLFLGRQTGVRIVDWWPSNGAFWSAATGEKGKADGPLDATHIARRIAGAVKQAA